MSDQEKLLEQKLGELETAHMDSAPGCKIGSTY